MFKSTLLKSKKNHKYTDYLLYMVPFIGIGNIVNEKAKTVCTVLRLRKRAALPTVDR